MTIKKVLAALFVLFLAFILVSTYFSYRLLKKSLPKEKGVLQVRELTRPVHVYRDANGIPHIVAANDHDLYVAAGFVTAQDRLWQLELIRLTVRGELATMIGDTARHVDRFMRTLEFYALGQKLFQHASEKSKEIISAYVAGINAFIRQGKNHYPIEFILLNHDPGLWTPADVTAYGRLMAWGLSLSWYVEWTAERIRERLGPARAAQLFGEYPPSWPTILSPKDWQFSAALTPFETANRELRTFLGWRGSGFGSNNWVVSGEKTVTGKPLLANDPHLALANPSVWYAMQLTAPGVNATGFSLVGAPGIILGHNEHVAWGFTNVMADDADFFVEKLNPADSTQYRYGGKWEKMTIVQDSVVSRSGKIFLFTRRKTRHGPVISDVNKLMKTSGRVISLRWTGQELSDETDAIYKMNRAKNAHDFVQALRAYRSPAQNIVFADDQGTIGYWCTGAIPIRSGFSGAYPVDGSNPAYRWIGMIPFEKLPHVLNPSEGFVATANNRVTPRGYPYRISNMWEPPSRVQRIRERLTAKKKLSELDFENIQLDVLSPFARDVTANILKILEKQKTKSPQMDIAYRYLKGWDFEMRGESTATTIFHLFLTHFLRNTFHDELGDTLYKAFLEFGAFPLRDLQQMLAGENQRWFDDVTTQNVRETKEDQILRSLTQAIHELETKFGPKPEKWRWDKLHTITFRHLLGSQAMLAKIFNIGPLPLGGGLTTVNNARYQLNKPYQCWVGPSMRMIVDFSDLSNMKLILPPGEVEHPLSPHFRDQADMWVNGLYLDCKSDIRQIEEEGKTLTLQPAAN